MRLSDNLQSARLVLLVEGGMDQTFWRAVLDSASDELSDALEAGTLVVERSVGAGNLSYQLQTLRRSACDAFVVFDSDGEGRAQVNRALEDFALLDSEYLLVTPAGRANAEIEDLLADEWTSPILAAHFGVTVSLEATDKPWGQRLRVALTAAGKNNSSATIDRAKEAIWDAYEPDAAGALSPGGRAFIDAVVHSLTSRISDPG